MTEKSAATPSPNIPTNASNPSNSYHETSQIIKNKFVGHFNIFQVKYKFT
jgi:hypothetical protein